MRKSLNKVTRKKAMLGAFSLLLVMLMVVVACGDAATPTAIPATAEPAAPAATAEPAAPAATARPAAPAATTAPAAPAAPVATKAPGQVLVATKAPVAPAPAPSTGGVRPISDWTEAEPATLEEIEAALETYRGSSLNITSWGGSWQGYVRQAYWAPFTEKFGIQIVEDSPISSAKIRSMAETGNVTWDVVDFGTRTVYSLGEVGALEEMTPAIHGGYMDGLPEVTKTPWSAGGGVFWSMGIAYSLDSYPNHVGAPKNFADVWDAERFPGRRSLQARANENVIFAQMALHPEKMETQEGRDSLGSLTDAQVDESMAAISDINNDIAHWWTSYTACPEGLISGEFDMCVAGNGRIEDANSFFCFDCGHIVQTGVYASPLGTPKKNLAELYMAWIGFPEIAVEISKLIAYGPLHNDAIALANEILDDDWKAKLPTSPAALKQMVIMDEYWLGHNLDKGQMLVERFIEATATTD